VAEALGRVEDRLGRYRVGARGALWLLLPTLLLFAFTYVGPMLVLFPYSVYEYEAGVMRPAVTLQHYAQFFTDGVTLRIFWTTVELALVVTATTLVLGYPVALLIRRTPPRRRLLILAVIVSPLLTSVIVRNFAWLLILGRQGFLNQVLQGLGVVDSPLRLVYNLTGVVIGVVHVYLPFMVLPVYSALAAIDPAAEESAMSLGAGPWRTFLHVTLPLSLPGVVAGGTLVFVMTLGVYLTPVIMGGNFVVTLPMVIGENVSRMLHWPAASAEAFVLLASTAIVIFLATRFVRLEALGGIR
jgi:putative spermidine/putrescine transport system permease protein